MGCSVLSVVTSVAGAGLLGGAGLVPGLGGLSSLAGGLTGGLGGLGGLAGGLGGLAGGLGDLGGLAGGLGGLANIPGLDGIGSLAQSFGALGTDLIPDLAGSMGGIVDQVKGELGGVIGQAQSLCGDAVKGALGDIGSSFTGAMDGSIISKLAGENITFPTGNLFDNVVQQSQSFLTNGMPGLTECIATAKGFCEQSAFLQGSISNALNPQLSKFNLQNTFGQITGGMVNNLLSPMDTLTKTLTSAVGGALPNPSGYLGTLQNAIGQSSQAFSSLTGDLSKWGSLYPKDSISNFYSPNKIVENLVGKNIPSFNNFLGSNGINPSQVAAVNPSKLQNVMEKVTGQVLNDVVSKADFQVPVKNLAEVLSPQKVLSTKTQSVFGGFSGVSKQIASMGPTNTPTFSSLAEKMSQVEFPRASPLLGIEQDKSRLNYTLNYKKYSRPAICGEGQGVFNNPTMDDIMGSFHGTEYNLRLAGLLQGQRKILASPTGILFQQAIDKAVANVNLGLATDQEDAAAIRGAYTSMLESPNNQEVVQVMTNFYNEIQDKLILERRNLKAARLDPVDAVGGIYSINNFLQSLDTAYQDDFKVGYSNWVNNSADTDIFGEAIRAAMIQGKNNNIAQSLGIDTALTSVVDYTDEEAVRRAKVLSNCCPPYSGELIVNNVTVDTLLNTYCDGANLYGIYADGEGLSYARLIEANTLDCIYAGVSFTLSWNKSAAFTSGGQILITITSDSPIPDGTVLTFTSFLNPF